MMAKRWEDQGNGRWKLTVTSDEPGDGTPMQVFYGSKEEIADKLADAQGNATRRIAELKKQGLGTRDAGTGPKPMNAAERMQAVADLNDPASVDKGVARVVESVIGPIETIRADRERERQERETQAAIAAAESFAGETPDWYPSEYNKTKLVGFMRTQGLNPASRAHYTQAFEELSAAGLLQKAPRNQDDNPEETEPAAERIAPATPAPKPPTRISTGIRSQDVSGSAPRPGLKPKYTREQIANMSAATYKRLMTTDPELARSEEFYARQPRRKAS